MTNCWLASFVGIAARASSTLRRDVDEDDCRMLREIKKPQAAEVKSGWSGVRIVGAATWFLRYDAWVPHEHTGLELRLKRHSLTKQTLVYFQNAL